MSTTYIQIRRVKTRLLPFLKHQVSIVWSLKHTMKWLSTRSIFNSSTTVYSLLTSHYQEEFLLSLPKMHLLWFFVSLTHSALRMFDKWSVEAIEASANVKAKFTWKVSLFQFHRMSLQLFKLNQKKWLLKRTVSSRLPLKLGSTWAIQISSKSEANWIKS